MTSQTPKRELLEKERKELLEKHHSLDLRFPHRDIYLKLGSSVHNADKSEVEEFSDWVVGKTKGRKLTDIRAGHHGIWVPTHITYKIAENLGCPEVCLVDPVYEREEILSSVLKKVPSTIKVATSYSDALSYIETQDDNSSVVMANGLFNEPLELGTDPKMNRYVGDLIKEVYRVTPTIFFGNCMNYDIREKCKSVGFKKLDPVSNGTPLMNWFVGLSYPPRELFLFVK